jgi:hypothetical protein
MQILDQSFSVIHRPTLQLIAQEWKEITHYFETLDHIEINSDESIDLKEYT